MSELHIKYEFGEDGEMRIVPDNERARAEAQQMRDAELLARLRSHAGFTRMRIALRREIESWPEHTVDANEAGALLLQLLRGDTWQGG